MVVGDYALRHVRHWNRSVEAVKPREVGDTSTNCYMPIVTFEKKKARLENFWIRYWIVERYDSGITKGLIRLKSAIEGW